MQEALTEPEGHCPSVFEKERELAGSLKEAQIEINQLKYVLFGTEHNRVLRLVFVDLLCNI